MFLSFLVVILLFAFVFFIFFLGATCISLYSLVKKGGDEKRIYLYRKQRKGCIIAIIVVFVVLLVCSIFGIRG